MSECITDVWFWCKKMQIFPHTPPPRRLDLNPSHSEILPIRYCWEYMGPFWRTAGPRTDRQNHRKTHICPKIVPTGYFRGRLINLQQRCLFLKHFDNCFAAAVYIPALSLSDLSLRPFGRVVASLCGSSSQNPSFATARQPSGLLLRWDITPQRRALTNLYSPFRYLYRTLIARKANCIAQQGRDL